jgi:hypothetical protein
MYFFYYCYVVYTYFFATQYLRFAEMCDKLIESCATSVIKKNTFLPDSLSPPQPGLQLLMILDEFGSIWLLFSVDVDLDHFGH